MERGVTNILITGGAGFIGYSLTDYLLSNYPEVKVVLVDNLNQYYDTSLKRDRLKQLDMENNPNLLFYELDIANKQAVDGLFREYQFTHVVNLAAQAGVRYAKVDPDSYIRSNIDGFFNVIDQSAKSNVDRFIYASSSSVYGANYSLPSKESEPCQSPMSLYAATKLSNESIAKSYMYTYGLKSIGLRFFNVYGPWGRPDMAYFKWTDAMKSGDEIEVRHNGEMWRDMTYVEDVIKVIVKVLNKDIATTTSDVFNVGNRNPVKIIDTLNYLGSRLSIEPKIRFVEKGSEEPVKTYADTEKLQKFIGFTPDTPYKNGLDRFIDWHNQYYN